MPRNKHIQSENLLLFPVSLPETGDGIEATRIFDSRPKIPVPTRTTFPKQSKSTLFVKLLEAEAKLPVVAHPGEDLGYDVFALEGVSLAPWVTVKVRTGIAVEAHHPATGAPLGLLVRDRSSMAAKGIATTGGVIDAGYRGEILVLMTNLGDTAVELKAGEKIAQMIPVPVLTGAVEEVENLEDSARAEKGFGSSGR
jgi:dUTP pyrophosphatase